MNVTGDPWQTGPAGDAAIETLAGAEVVILAATVFDVAGDPVAHELLDVITTDIWSPLARVDDMNVALTSPPIATPPFIHW